MQRNFRNILSGRRKAKQSLFHIHQLQMYKFGIQTMKSVITLTFLVFFFCYIRGKSKIFLKKERSTNHELTRGSLIVNDEM